MKRFIFALFLAIVLLVPSIPVTVAAAPFVKSDIQSPTLIRKVSTLAELQAIPVTSAAIKSVYVEGRLTAGDGYEGTFYALTGDQSANASVVADTLQGVYVKPTAPGDGSTGVWVRQRSIMFEASPLWFVSNTTPGTTDMSAAFQAAADTQAPISVAPGEYLFTTTVNITTAGQRITGSGRGLTNIITKTNIILFKVTGIKTIIEHLQLDAQLLAYNVPHVWYAGDSFSTMRDVVITAFEDFTATGGGILLDDGAGGIGGSVGDFTNINISHGGIDVRRSDVHIANSWIWCNSRPWGIKASGSVGNLTVVNCDVLPPQTLVAGRKAAIYLTGALSIPRILGVNFDGNTGLSTGTGLLAENGVLGLNVVGGNSFGHDEDAMILDSVINPQIIGVSFYTNNNSANGSSDIVLRQNFGQLMEKPLISGNSFTQPSAIGGTLGSAVKVIAGTNRNGMRIVDNMIHQPGTGGGYTDVEILLEDGAFASSLEGSLRGNAGTRTKYAQSSSSSVLSSTSFVTVTYPATMAYAPRPDQFTLQYATSGTGPIYRFNSTGLPTTSSAGLGLVGHSDGTLYWSAELR